MHTLWQVLALLALAWCLWRRQHWLRARELLLIHRTSTPDLLYDYRQIAMVYTALSLQCALWVYWLFHSP